MALGPGSRPTLQEDDSVFAPAVPFKIEDMPKGQLDNFEGGPIDARFVLFDYGGQQAEYGIHLSVWVKFRTEDGDEGEENYLAGDLRFFRPALPPGINFPPGYYDDKTRNYYIDGLKGATAEQLKMYSSDKYLSKILPPKPGEDRPRQATFGQNKNFGKLIAKAQAEGWPYDEALLTQSLSAFMRTMYGRWDRVDASSNKSAQPPAQVGGGLAAEAAGAGKQSKARKILLLTQYVPPPPAWVAQWGGQAGGVQTTPAGLVVPQGVVMPTMPPQMVMQPQPMQPAPVVTPQAQLAGTLDQIIPMIATPAIASHMTASGGQPATVQAIAQAVMAGVKASGGEPGPAFLMFIKPENLTRWAQAYGWVYDPAGQTLRMGG